MQELFQEIELHMKHSVDHLGEEFKQLRTGHASIAILDAVKVDYYGTLTPVAQLAGLSAPEPTLITVQPYDPTVIPAIERAILTSDLGLNPSNDGKLIRIPIPPLTEERRKEIVKRAHEMAEAARNAVRHARRDGNDGIKQLEKDKEIGEDDERRGYDEVQRLHDHYITLINEHLATKEADILTV